MYRTTKIISKNRMQHFNLGKYFQALKINSLSKNKINSGL